MLNSWWLLLEAVLFLILMHWTRTMAYNHGIWDGAFNHFLPHVRKQMLYYDERRAKEIFAAEADTVQFIADEDD